MLDLTCIYMERLSSIEIFFGLPGGDYMHIVLS